MNSTSRVLARERVSGMKNCLYMCYTKKASLNPHTETTDFTRSIGEVISTVRILILGNLEKSKNLSSGR